MSWQIGTITLPRAPDLAGYVKPAKIKEFDLSSSMPILISECLGAKTLKLEGIIHGGGSTLAQLETAFITPLDAYVGTTLTLACPDSRYDGTWLMSRFEFQEIAEGGEAKFNYLVEFKQGTEHVVL